MSDNESMTNDPAAHRAWQREMIAHVEKLLAESGWQIDMHIGLRSTAGYTREVKRSDRAVEIKRLMTSLGVPDPELQARLPLDESLQVVLSRNWMLIFQQLLGEVRVECRSPMTALIRGETPAPMTSADVRRILVETPLKKRVPQTLIIVSTSGFEMEARELVQRTSERVVVLAEPNGAGGWTIHGPSERRAMLDRLDPEPEEAKRERVRRALDARHADLLLGGVSADVLASSLKLPMGWVEQELRRFSQEHPQYLAKRLDGRLVIYRDEGSSREGSVMSIVEWIKSLFSRGDSLEKQLASLKERQAELNAQREQKYKDLASLEQREDELKKQFAGATGDLARKRIVQQILQVQKEMSRRQQLIEVLNKQANVIAAHLHNIELQRQGDNAKLPTAEELAEQAAKAEEALAGLEAGNEIADEVSDITLSGMSDQEKALYDELMGAQMKDTEKSATSGAGESAPREPGQRERGHREPRQREPGQREPGQREPRQREPAGRADGSSSESIDVRQQGEREPG